MSTLKVDTITTISGTGNINVSRPLSGSGASLTSLPAGNLTGTLPAISGASLTSLTAANLTGALPAISGASLTGLPASGVTPKMKLVRSTYAFSGVPGTQTISSIGFAPDVIYGMWGVGNDPIKGPSFFWAINPSSSLAQSGTSSYVNFHHNEQMTAASWRTNSDVRWADGQSAYVSMTITTWGSDGITITYTKTGSPATGATMNMETAFFKLT
jgi:hypothetical protein